ncbi:MAG: DUF3368 domain-containing protein [Candidatus Aminicenantes bacterium]|nr:DUF3368 domain-containing protein [Candidatus Aminicenantes bacterium]
MKKVVSNATPIISLAGVEKLPIFNDLFQKVIIPGAVFKEIYLGKYPGYKDLDSDLFEIQELGNPEKLDFLLNELDRGESESILLAKEISADILIIDERHAYKIAQSQGLNVIGTLSVLLMAKERGLIKNIKPVLDEMINQGRWYSKRVYEYFLMSIGEL